MRRGRKGERREGEGGTCHRLGMKPRARKVTRPNPALRRHARKLCYRKDDRAMRPIHWCPENFQDSLTTPTATIPNIFHGLLFGSTLRMFLRNLKSVALPVPEIRGGS